MARTRSKEAHARVLEAALRLISERGIEATSMDAIAAASGVSKATVYKHWTNKDALLIDVIRNHSEKLPEFDSGQAREDLLQFVRYLARARHSQEMGRIWPRIVGYAAANPEFTQALREYAFAPRRAQIQRILTAAAREGQLRPGIDADFAMDLVMGPLMHRRFSGVAMSADLADRIVEYFWEVFKAR